MQGKRNLSTMVINMKLAYPLWIEMPQKLNTELPPDPALPLLFGVHPKKESEYTRKIPSYPH